MPKMKHRSGGRQIDVKPDMVPMYESQGWQTVAPTPKKTSESSSSTGSK